MQLTSQQSLPVSQSIAWQALNDVTMLQAAIPGCESLTVIGENEYEAALSVAIGPVKAKFKGRLKLSELQPPESYRIAFEGQGGQAGHGKGTAQVRLEAVSANETLLHYEVQASVGGKIAQIGSRLIDMAAQKMANDFFASFNTLLQQRYAVAPVEAANAPAPGGAWQRLLAWLGRLFGRKT
nr:carbon monoxide dehydrogenase subunit G [uncultured Roseateles sp.]